MFVGKFIISVMDTRWVLAETEHVGNDLIGLPKPIKSVLISRDICSMADLEQFLNPPHKLPYDPLRLAGMDQAYGGSIWLQNKTKLSEYLVILMWMELQVHLL